MERRVRTWQGAKRRIDSIEATAPSLDGPQQRLEKLLSALEREVARLRAPLPEATMARACQRSAVDGFRRARAQIAAAEEDLSAMEESSRVAAANADEWERLAMLAVNAEGDDLAREALARRADLVLVHRALQRDVDAGRAVLAEMRAALARMAPEDDDPEPG